MVTSLGTMPPYLRDLLTSDLAFVALFVVFVLEGAMLMYFMPSELIVPGALALFGATPTQVAAVLAVAVIGATVGQYLLFRLARRVGREYLLESRWFRVSDDRLGRFEGWFDRWGPFVVPISNALLFTRPASRTWRPAGSWRCRRSGHWPSSPRSPASTFSPILRCD